LTDRDIDADWAFAFRLVFLVDDFERFWLMNLDRKIFTNLACTLVWLIVVSCAGKHASMSSNGQQATTAVNAEAPITKENPEAKLKETAMKINTFLAEVQESGKDKDDEDESLAVQDDSPKIKEYHSLKRATTDSSQLRKRVRFLETKVLK
jgi:hypothetical protein